MAIEITSRKFILFEREQKTGRASERCEAASSHKIKSNTIYVTTLIFLFNHIINDALSFSIILPF
jgi:hypothetical protein